MKTRELIEILQAYDQDTEVSIVFYWQGETVLDEITRVVNNAGPQICTASFDQSD